MCIRDRPHMVDHECRQPGNQTLCKHDPHRLPAGFQLRLNGGNRRHTGGCLLYTSILSLSVPGVPTQNTINILQDHGICVSAGSACAKGHRCLLYTSRCV